MADTPYNPLDKRNLAESLATALLRKPAGPLPPPEEFQGAGIYAIYYSGDFDPYRLIAEKNRGDDPQQPIYVGKAVPPGTRKGGFRLANSPGPALFRRLREHASSIDEVDNLRREDFTCRYLVSDDIWIPLGESLLIDRFGPLWNVRLEGFGIHDPGGRRPQRRSMWDTLHPGRGFAAERPANQSTPEQLAQMVREFLAGREGGASILAQAASGEEPPRNEEEWESEEEEESS